jgi:hypothetical protein
MLLTVMEHAEDLIKKIKIKKININRASCWLLFIQFKMDGQVNIKLSCNCFPKIVRFGDIVEKYGEPERPQMKI